MYEAVTAAPEGDSTVSRFAHTACEYGFDGIVVRNWVDARPPVDVERIRERYDVDVVAGIEVRTDDPGRASREIRSARERTPLLLVRGGNPVMNRFAVEEERVDVLTSPMSGDGDFDHVLAREAVRNGVRVEFDFTSVLRSEGGARVVALSRIRKLRELIGAYDVPYVVSGAPTSHLQVRSPRELIAVGERIGFTRMQVESGLSEWYRLATRNRERRSEAFIEPGVERGRYERTDG